MTPLKKERATNHRITIDYKCPATLYPFLTEGGKISPARITGLMYSQQKQLRQAIKKARALSLLPSSATAYDNFGFPAQISAVPFEIE